MRTMANWVSARALAGCGVVACLALSGAAPATATIPLNGATAKTAAAVRPAVSAAFPSAPGWLNSMAVVSESDVWAVGISQLGGGLIFHWNGKRWSYVHAAGYFNGVAARAAADVWAVGVTSQVGDVQGIAMHWNGRSWTRVATPALSGSGYLNAVAATSASNAWAVGQAGPAPGSTSPAQPLIEHWNGRHWTVQRFPSLPGGGEFRAVAALSATSAWAVGSAGSQTLVAHWNGTKWSRWASPNLGTYASWLSGVTVIAANDAWAVGTANPPDGSARTLTAFWNGRHWRLVASPSRAGNAALYSVTASGAHNIWAVGTAYTTPGCVGDGCGPYLTLIMHWNGTRWTMVPSPNPEQETIYIALNGVAAVTGGNIWAVGNANYASTLILHWNGKAWSA